MKLEQLHDYKGQFEQAMSCATHDIEKYPKSKYVTDMMVVQTKLEAALLWIDQAIKNNGDEELKI